MDEMDILDEVRYLTCNVCARRCYLTATLGVGFGQAEAPGKGRKPGQTLMVSGNSCSNGVDYARSELLESRRIISSTVATTFPDVPRVRVTSQAGVPVDRLLEAMAALDEVTVTVRLRPGDLVVDDLLGLGVKVVVG